MPTKLFHYVYPFFPLLLSLELPSSLSPLAFRKVHAVISVTRIRANFPMSCTDLAATLDQLTDLRSLPEESHTHARSQLYAIMVHVYNASACGGCVTHDERLKAGEYKFVALKKFLQTVRAFEAFERQYYLERWVYKQCYCNIYMLIFHHEASTSMYWNWLEHTIRAESTSRRGQNTPPAFAIS